MAQCLNGYERRRIQRKEDAKALLKAMGLDRESIKAEYMKPSSSKTKQKSARIGEDEDDAKTPTMKDDALSRPKRAKKSSVVSCGLNKLFNPDHEELSPQETVSVTDTAALGGSHANAGDSLPRDSSSKTKQKRARSGNDEDNVKTPTMKDDALSRPKRAKKSVVSCDLNKLFNPDHDELSPQETVSVTDTAACREEVKRICERSKRPSRRKSKVGVSSCREEDLSGDDEWLYCEECGHSCRGDCLVHGPLTPLDETLGKDSKSATFTSLFVPKQLTVKKSSIPKAGLGVFATEVIPKRVQCGPFKGNMIPASDVSSDMDTTYMWEIMEGKEVAFIVDAKDLSTANWMRYVNCASNDAEQNMEAFQYKGSMFYRTSRPIQPGEELLVWYGEAYAKELGIDVPLPLEDESSVGREGEKMSSRNDFTIAFKCLGCGNGFVEHQSFKLHLKNSEGCDSVNPQTFTCQKCGVTFSRLLQLQCHIRQHLQMPPVEQGNGSTKPPTHHTGGKPYKCMHCDYSCSHKSRLKSHLLTHTGDKPFKCEHCDYCCSHNSHLKSHLRKHTGDKPFKCEHCDYSCSQLGNLKTHLITHTGDKPFKCEHCGFCCSHLGNLKTHLKTHTGDKPFKCEHCDYSCSQLGNLKRHLLKHTGVKPFKCEHCDYCCSHLGNLKKHLLKHTGDKPFKCEHCDYSCNRSDHLEKHLKTHL